MHAVLGSTDGVHILCHCHLFLYIHKRLLYLLPAGSSRAAYAHHQQPITDTPLFHLQSIPFSMPLMALLYILLGGLLLSSMHTPSCSAAPANGDTLVAGQSLAAGDKLVSKNDKFALGFFQFQPPPTAIISKSTDTATTTTTSSSSLGWYLGIWFNKIPVFTPVWVANREKPISYPELKLTQLKISRDGNLAIILSNNATTESIIWSTTHFVNRSIETNTKGTSAILMNTGNLALVAESPSNEVPLWQSFDYPTDVGIPGAKLGRNKVTGLKWQYISKKSMIDPSLGSYIL